MRRWGIQIAARGFALMDIIPFRVCIHLAFSTKDRRTFLRDKPTRDARDMAASALNSDVASEL